MKEIKTYLDRLQLMNELIINGRTGTPEEFAKRLGVCRRSLYAYIALQEDLMAEDNVKIIYNRRENAFQYDKQGKFDLNYRWCGIK